MERFELPTGPPILQDPAATRATLVGSADGPRDDDWDPDAVVCPAARSFDGLVAVGALTGSAAAVVVGSFAGWTGTSSVVAVLVGLDVGLLAGAGISGLLARRQSRATPATGQ